MILVWNCPTCGTEHQHDFEQESVYRYQCYGCNEVHIISGYIRIVKVEEDGKD